MSNQNNRPRLGMPGNTPPPPLAPPPAPPAAIATPAALPAHVETLLKRFPLPWCVGPDGYLWVAADVMKITNRDDIRPGDTPEGWRASRIPPRLVLEHKLPADLADVILHAINGLTLEKR